MIIVKDIDNFVYLFESIEKAEEALEAIDIENNEYAACDENGVIYRFELLESPKAFSEGKFRIMKTAERDSVLPKKYFMDYGKALHKSIEKLEEIYIKSSGPVEAIKTLTRMSNKQDRKGTEGI